MDLTIGRRAEVERHLRALGWIRPDERLLALAPAGAGNMYRALRAELPDRTLILEQSVPFVAKYPSIAAPPELRVVRLQAARAFVTAWEEKPGS